MPYGHVECPASGFRGVPQHSGCSGAACFAKEQTQVEGADVDEQSLEDVVVLPKMGSSHGPGFVAVGEATFNEFGASFSVLDAFGALDASTVFVNGFLFGRFVLPFSAAAVGFADAGHEAVLFV